jgi:hypothetical protein
MQLTAATPSPNRPANNRPPLREFRRSSWRPARPTSTRGRLHLSSRSHATSSRACARAAATRPALTATATRTTARREHLTTGCLGTGREPARCPNCGRIDSGTLEFLPEPDPIADLLSGRIEPSAEYLASQLARVAFGDQVAHYITWSWQDRKLHHGHLAISGQQIRLRLRRADEAFEAASPCTADRRRGRRWSPVTSAADLLAVHTHGPSRAASPCDRCGTAPQPLKSRV